MRRLFTFGCSFTEYKWPTWADILGREFDYFENWGRCGAGNSFILYSLSECIKRNKISKHDTVIIMWSSIAREDRWVKTWITPGSIYTQNEYDENFVKKYANPTGYLIRDLAIISSTKQVLDSIGCSWQFLSMVPLNYYYDDSVDEFDSESIINKNVLKLYKDEVLSIKPSVYELVFNNDWYSRPLESPEGFEAEYNIFRGQDWPTWQNFKANIFGNIPDKIKAEIKDRFFKKSIRMDIHPTPQEHLLYLDLLQFEISAETRVWINEYTDINRPWVTTKPRIRF